MVFEYILKKNNLNPSADLIIDQSVDFGSTAAAFSGGQADFTVVRALLVHHFSLFTQTVYSSRPFIHPDAR